MDPDLDLDPDPDPTLDPTPFFIDFDIKAEIFLFFIHFP
jgi:hypothetical protein